MGGGWGVPKSWRKIYMLDTGIRTSKGFGQSSMKLRSFNLLQDACVIPMAYVYQNVSIVIFNVYIYIYTYFSIHPFHLQSNSHSTTPQATNIFNPLFDLPLTIATEQLPFTTSDRAVGRQCTTALTPLQVLPCPWEDWPVTGDVANNLLLCWWNQCGLSVW